MQLNVLEMGIIEFDDPLIVRTTYAIFEAYCESELM